MQSNVVHIQRAHLRLSHCQRPRVETRTRERECNDINSVLIKPERVLNVARVDRSSAALSLCAVNAEICVQLPYNQ
jgi:hypothetical protein